MRFSKEIAVVAVLGVLFIFAAYISETYEAELGALFEGYGLWGMALYVFLSILAVVAAPFSSLPLVPIASSLWGPFAAGLLSALGWTIGAIIAFGLASRYGRPLVEKLVDLKVVESIKSRLPRKGLFGTVVMLRMTIPVDILSYALGLFVPLDWKLHAIATVIGVLPFAFVFSYAGALPWQYQAAALALALAVVSTIFFILRNGHHLPHNHSSPGSL